MRFELYKEPAGTYHYRLIGDWFRHVLMSQQYNRKDYALRDMETVKRNLHNRTNIELKTTEQGDHYFEVRNGEGRVLTNSCLFRTVQALRAKLHYIIPRIQQAAVIEKL